VWENHECSRATIVESLASFEQALPINKTETGTEGTQSQKSLDKVNINLQSRHKNLPDLRLMQ